MIGSFSLVILQNKLDYHTKHGPTEVFSKVLMFGRDHDPISTRNFYFDFSWYFLNFFLEILSSIDSNTDIISYFPIPLFLWYRDLYFLFLLECLWHMELSFSRRIKIRLVISEVAFLFFFFFYELSKVNLLNTICVLVNSESSYILCISFQIYHLIWSMIWGHIHKV